MNRAHNVFYTLVMLLAVIAASSTTYGATYFERDEIMMDNVEFCPEVYAEQSPIRQISGQCRNPHAQNTPIVAGTRWLYDKQGRAVFLRGFNYSHRSKYPPWTNWMRESHFEMMADWGTNAVRLVVIWEALEPKNDEFNQEYLDRLGRVIRWCEKNDIMVLLDMHQDLYSRLFGGDGAPPWAVIQKPDNMTYEFTNKWPKKYFTEPVIANFDRLWSSKKLQNQFADAWIRVVKEFKNRDNVIGYDLLNEPWPGSHYWKPWFEDEYLVPFYKRIIDSIRSVDPNRPVYVEPWALVSGNFNSFMQRFDRENVVYIPHVYDAFGKGWRVYPGEWYQNWLVGHMEVKRRYLNMPFVIGEWGMERDHPELEKYLTDHFRQHDHYMVPGTFFWNFDPTAPVSLDVKNENPNFARHVEPSQDSPILADGSKTRDWKLLVRAYPRRIAGMPVRFQWDRETKVFTLEYRNSPGVEGPTKIFLPTNTHLKDGFKLETSDTQNYEHSFDEENKTLTYTHDPTVRNHTITVKPK